jgi:cell shape-determining protein MreC
MRRISYTPYALLLAIIFFILVLPFSFTISLRSFVVRTISPSWRGVNVVKGASLHLLTIPTIHEGSSIHLEEKVKELQRENQLLTSQLDHMRQWLLSEDRIEEQLQRMKDLQDHSENEAFAREFYKRRSFEISKILELQFQSLPAKVVFREPASWSSFVWINVGEKHNRSLGKQIVAKNSPVVVDGCLIGIVENVRNSQSRVRLITDAHLSLAVRTIRGKQQNEQLSQQLESVFRMLEVRKDLFQTAEEQRAITAFFSRLKARMNIDTQDRYLAKGLLQGGGAPLWRARGSSLLGIGFNYDFADAEGPARDLRSGKAKDSLNSLESLAILREGDLLITSGLDGIFPAGLPVAIVRRVENLREGACSYDIKAEAVAGSLNNLSAVVVLPPLHFDKNW